MRKLFFLFTIIAFFAHHVNGYAEGQRESITPGQNIGAVCVIPEKGLCWVKGKKLEKMDFNGSLPKITLPQPADAVVANGLQVFAKSGNMIYTCSPKLQKAFTFDSDNFLIFPSASKNFFYVVGFSGAKSKIYRCCPSNHTIEEVNYINEDIVYVCDTEEGLVVVTNEKVYKKSGEDWEKQLSFFEQINCATYTSKGLIIASDNYIALIVEQNRVIILAESGCKQLLSNDNILYIIDEEDNIFRFEL